MILDMEEVYVSTRSDMEGRGGFDFGVPKQALKYKIQVTTTPSLPLRNRFHAFHGNNFQEYNS